MRVVTFGEIMLRLTPYGHKRIVQADAFEAVYGGSEANVAVSLSEFGLDAAFVGKLPPHELGQAAVDALRRYGVDTRSIVRGGERLGLYYLEKGTSQRPNKVIYDRAGSAFACAQASEFDWHAILEGADWFHFSGITPALGREAACACLEAARIAKERGIPVSCDLNYRSRLWTRAEAERALTPLMPYVDVCISGDDDAFDVFGIRGQGATEREAAIGTAALLRERFGFRCVAMALRTAVSTDEYRWSGLLYDGAAHVSREYAVHAVDGIGGGDAFSAGLIYALLNGYGADRAIGFAAAAGCLKYSTEGDFNLTSVEEITQLAESCSEGKLHR